MECKICKNIVDNLSIHIQSHEINKKEYFDTYLKQITDGICIICGNSTKFYTLKAGYKKFCSVKCAKQHQAKNKTTIFNMLEKKRKTCINKYNVDHPMKSETGKINHKNSILKTYNTDHFSKTNEFKEKVKNTCIEKYGTEHFNKTVIGKEKIKNGVVKKYNVDNISKLEHIKNKIKQTKFNKYGDSFYNNSEKTKLTCLKKYGVPYVLQSTAIKQKINLNKKQKFINYLFNGTRLNNLVLPEFSPEEFIDVNTFYTFKCNTCGISFKDNLDDGLIPKCPICFKNNNISEMEKDFLNYCKVPSNNINRQVLINIFKVDGFKNNKIFEFLGDYWHGNPKKFIPTEINPSNKQTFGDLYINTVNKLHTLLNMGYKIYYIWESDWLNWLKNKIETFPIKYLTPNIVEV